MRIGKQKNPHRESLDLHVQTPKVGPGRCFLYFRFHGKDLHGWQRQSNALSVQELAENALSTLWGQPMALVGAGRTDAGVHALELPAHFDAPEAFDPARLQRSLNALLDPRIAVFDLKAVTPEAHARFSAVERTYHYHLHSDKDPFLSDRSAFVPRWPDFERMNEAASQLLGTRDYGSFARTGGAEGHQRCAVRRAEWIWEANKARFEISADRFLRNMVRAIVGTLLEIGQRKRSVSDLETVLSAVDRRAAGESAPAQGLFLAQVRYPASIFLPTSTVQHP
ncbi:tRNA pseudouridine(38-40) synthase TruA [bacterium]|nr:tRNA pseudouridine(38-40) synthase TruA [bacterium]